MSTTTDSTRTDSHPSAPHLPHTGKPGSDTGARPKSKLAPRLLAGAAAAGVAIWLGQFFVHLYHYEKTDNAYVVGHIHRVSSQVAGQVKEVLVTDNQTVKAGDVLLRLDPTDFEIKVQKARASLALARAQEAQAQAALAQREAAIAETHARVAQAQGQVEQTRNQLELARINLARTEQLSAGSGAVTKADVDTSRTAAAVAEAASTAAQANLTAVAATVKSVEAALVAAHAQYEGAQASTAAAQAALGEAERSLAYTEIKAPAAGRIGNKSAEAGNYVQPGQSLISLAEPDAWIVANFKETQLPRIAVGQPVDFTIDAMPGVELHGQIDSLAPASGAQYALLPPDNATGNFNKVVQRVPVKIILDAASRRLVGDNLRLGYSTVVNVRVR